MVLITFTSNVGTKKNSQASKLSTEKKSTCSNSALVEFKNRQSTLMLCKWVVNIDVEKSAILTWTTFVCKVENNGTALMYEVAYLHKYLFLWK